MQRFETVVPVAIQDAEAAIRDALANHGFGVLTEIDVAATLHTKLGVTRPPLKILGACNPTFAHRALEVDPSVSLLLPCNVVVEATEDGTQVAAIDPRGLLDDPRFHDLADEAADALQAAIDEVASALL